MGKTTFLVFGFISLFMGHKFLVAMFAPPKSEIATHLLDFALPLSAGLGVAIYLIGYLKTKPLNRCMLVPVVWLIWLGALFVLKAIGN